jgi:hypothetical protein
MAISRTARTARTAHQPPLARIQRAALRIRWDRVGRVALLLTLAVVVCLYIQPALSIFNTWRAERHQASIVHQLLSSNRALERQVAELSRPSTIVASARALGMVRAGERPYVVVGPSTGPK